MYFKSIEFSRLNDFYNKNGFIVIKNFLNQDLKPYKIDKIPLNEISKEFRKKFSGEINYKIYQRNYLKFDEKYTNNFIIIFIVNKLCKFSI